MSERKKFSRKLKSKEFDIENEAGVVEVWTMKELVGVQRNSYLNAQSKKVTVKNGVETKDFTGLGTDLLCLCLYSPDGKLATSNELANWPSEMQMDLFVEAVELSGLNKKAEDAEKKD